MAVQRHLIIAGGAALVALLVVLAWPRDGDQAGEAALATSGATSYAASPGTSDVPRGGFVPASPVAPAGIDAPRTAAPVQAETARSLAAPFASSVVPLAAAAPPRLQVGEMEDVVISIGAGAAVGEVGFTIRFDPNVLQARAGSEGDWAAMPGDGARFVAEISGAEDRVQIRSARSVKRLSGAGGSIALVQFQAVAPGSTWVLISEVTVKDVSGNALPFTLSPASLQVTAEPPAPPL